MIQIVIDGKYRIVEQGQTVLEAAKTMVVWRSHLYVV